MLSTNIHGRSVAKAQGGKVTIHDVAAQAGVAAMTVSRVINGSKRVATDTRERIQQAIDDLGYIPNALARGLLTGRTRTIGLLVGDITNPYWTAVASGAEEVAHQNGYTVVLGNLADSEEKEDLLIEKMIGNRVDGFLINSPATKPLRRLMSREYPLVLIGPEHKGIHTDIVRGDVYLGAQQLTQHLLDLGHRRIALLNGPREDFEAQQRALGFVERMRHDGVEPDPSLIVNGSYSYGGGARAAAELLRLPAGQRPEAIVASNNFLALSVIEAARELEIRVPEDVALVCFDDFVLASIIHPFLTVMSQPAKVLGAQAAQLLVNRLNNAETWRPTKLIFTPELIVRRSCGATLRTQPNGLA